MKQSMVGNVLKVEASGSIAVVRCTNGTKVRLLGASFPTDSNLYENRDQIAVSPERNKNGVIALSVSNANGDFFAHGLFEVSWVGQNKDKIWINLQEEVSPTEKGGMSDNGFDIQTTFIDVVTSYRVPFVFWNERKGSEMDYGSHLCLLSHHHKIFSDGNVFCRYFVGDADASDLETAVNQYRLDTDPEFQKATARGLVGDRILFASWTKKNTEQNLKIGELNKEIEQLMIQIKSSASFMKKYEILIEKIRQVAIEPCMTWWNKLREIRKLLSEK